VIWRPLLPQTLAAAASRIAKLSRCLREPNRLGRLPSAALDGGLAGVALCLAQLSSAGYVSIADVTRATKTLQTGWHGRLKGPGLYNGLAGLGWVLSQLSATTETNWVTALSFGILSSLTEWLSDAPTPVSIDAVDGLVGIGVFALEYGNESSAAICLELIVKRLAEQMESNLQGITWVTSNPTIVLGRPPETAQQAHDLGAAHGIPGLSHFLPSYTDSDWHTLVCNGCWMARLTGYFGNAGRWATALRLLTRRKITPAQRVLLGVMGTSELLRHSGWQVTVQPDPSGKGKRAGWLG
jgi:hypothetical protein